MKKITFLLIIILALNTNCSEEKNNLEREILFGKWYQIDYPANIVEFTKDSLIFRTIMPTLQNWEIKGDEIVLSNSTNFYNEPLDPNYFPKTKYNYSISSNSDTLYLSVNRHDFSETYKLIRLKNEFKYYQEIFNLKIDLPWTDKPIKELKKDKFTIELRCGYSGIEGFHEGQLIYQFNYDDKFLNYSFLHHNFPLFHQEFLTEIDENEIEKVSVNLIFHKNHSQKTIDSIKAFIKQSGVNKIFRVYKNDSINYKNNLIWFGIPE